MTTATIQTNDEQLLLTYLQICGDSYGISKPSNYNNNPSSEWEKLELFDGIKTIGEYYDIQGLDFAIYHNSITNEVIVAIRGTEPFANDGDVEESAKILTKDTNLIQFSQLQNLHNIIQNTLKNFRYTGTTYKIVGQSLGGALASVYMYNLENGEYGIPIYNCSEAITINPIGVAYKYGQSDKVTNYLVMNDIFAMLNYDQQIGNVKLVFPIEIENGIDILAPHNDVIFTNKEANNFVNYVLDIDPSKWSSEKGVSIWYYDKNNILANQIMKFEYKAMLGLLFEIGVTFQTALPLDSVETIGTVVNIFSGAIKNNIDNISNIFLTTEDIEERENALTQLIMSDEDTVSILASNDLTMLEYIETISPLLNNICTNIALDAENIEDTTQAILDVLKGIESIIPTILYLSKSIPGIDSVIDKILAKATEENLKDAIDTINENIQNIPHKLHYRTTSGEYIIGTDDYITDKVINIGIDYLEGSKNDDIIWGRGNDDTIISKSGNNVLIGDYSTHTVSEIEFLRDNPLLVNEENFEHQDDGDDTIRGGKDNDLIIGGGGDDYLDGGGDNDYLYGGSGDDTLIGGIGDDRLYGGQGYDTYIINSGDGYDIIKDTDGKGHIEFNNIILHGAIMKNPIAGKIWIDSYGNIYEWDGIDGSNLIINGVTTVENYVNGQTLEIYLGKYTDPIPEEIEEYVSQMDPTKPMQDSPFTTSLPQRLKNLYPNYTLNWQQALESNGIPGDPIILDLDGNGTDITNVDNGVFFDYDGDGYAEATAWVKGNDGILTIDKNENGIIDNGSELVLMDALEQIDTNFDGIIDANDEGFADLKILKGDGTLQSLMEAGIEFISLNKRDVNYRYEGDNQQYSEGTFHTTNGDTFGYGEFNLQTDPSLALEKETVEVSDDIKELPDIRNMGKSSSLQQVMMKDESGELKQLVEAFISATNGDERMNLVEQILEKWTNSNEVEPGTRGNNVDAKHLAIIEVLMGTNFYSQNENEINPENPNLEAGQYLETLYEKIKVYVYAELIGQTYLKDLVKNIEIVSSEEGTLIFDLTNIVSILKNEMEENPIAAKQKVYELAKYIKGMGYEKNSNFFDPKDDNCFYTTFTKDDRELKWQIDKIGKVIFTNDRGDNEGSAADEAYRMEESDYIHALNGDDVAYGSDENDSFAMCSGDDLVDAGAGDDFIDTQGGDDIVFAGAGNDIIRASDGDDIIFGEDGDDIIYPDNSDEFTWAQDGNDIIRGGKGNDTIYSMVGDDTYIFYRGDGQDVVYEHQGIDTFYFGPDITWEDLIFEQSANDMIIKIKDTDDQITVKDWFIADEDGVYRYNNHKIEIFEFADGSKHYKDEINVGNNTESVTYNMEENNNYIELSGGYKTTVNLSEGWNHIVAGRNSDDTYILNTEQADVLIQDYDGNNTIKFGEGIQLAQTFFAYDENGLEVWFEYFDAQMRIQGELDTFRFEFSDGTVLNDVSDRLVRDISYTDYIMNENQKEIRLIGNENITVIDNDTDSNIITNNGNTTINFGKGHTYVESRNGGNDIYIYNLGDENKYINDLGGVDTIKFGEGITTENIHFLKNLETNELEIRFDLEYDNNDEIIIENFFGEENNKIEYFEFSDGSVIDDIEEYIRAWGSRNDEDLVIPNNISQAHLRGEGHISATGNDNDNWICGNEGDNSLIGGKGDDSYWDDCKTNERYYYNLGDGDDHIDDIGGIDAIIFGEGITKQNIRFNKDEEYGGLYIFFENHEGSIYINDYFNDEERKIELFKFSDGTTLDDIEEYINQETPVIQNSNSIVMEEEQTVAVIEGNSDAYVLGNLNDNYVTGNSGNNTYALSGGDDTVIDIQGGNDVYYYNINNGNDVITDIGGVDTIKFGRAINPDNLRFEQVEYDLVISFIDENRDGSVRIRDYFLDDAHKIEQFVFDDGTVLNDISDRLSGIAVFEDFEMAEDTDIEIVRMGGTENISVVGNSQDNVIVGNSGNNTYEGKGGNDILIDHAGGDDTYIYNIGDGYDTIEDIGGYDRIIFGEDVTLENLAFEQTSTDLNIWFHDIDDNGLCIRDFFSENTKKIERFELSDGSVIEDISDYITAIASESDVILPEGVPQIHLMGDGNTTATGNDGDNWIGGNDGDNTIIGGKGNDYLFDDRNTNETYIYNLGDGYDCINDFGGYDVVKFGEGISPENIVLMRNEGDLLIQFRDENEEVIEGEIRIDSYFNDDNKRIERLEFADGSTIDNIDNKITVLCGENDMRNEWRYAEIHLWGDNDIRVYGNYSDEEFFGNNGNNIYDPMGGTDIINAGSGNDTYIYNHDYGNKYIYDMGGYDVIKFGDEIDVENTRFVRNGNNLRIYSVNNGNSFIQIEDYFIDDNRKIERFEFMDGRVITEVTEELISGQASYGDIYLTENEDNAYLLGDEDLYVEGNNNANNSLYGNSGNSTFNGKGGNDYIESKQGGNDTYIYNIGDGYDFIVDIGGDDVVIFGEGISLEDVQFIQNKDALQIVVYKGEETGSIQIANYFKSDLRKIERFEFADGRVVTDVSSYLNNSGEEVDPQDPTNPEGNEEPLPDEPIDEEEPILPLSDGSDFDVNLLIQEINAYGTDSDVVMTEIQNPNNDELLLAMVS